MRSKQRYNLVCYWRIHSYFVNFLNPIFVPSWSNLATFGTVVGVSKKSTRGEWNCERARKIRNRVEGGGVKRVLSPPRLHSISPTSHFSPNFCSPQARSFARSLVRSLRLEKERKQLLYNISWQMIYHKKANHEDKVSPTAPVKFSREAHWGTCNDPENVFFHTRRVD